MKNEKKGKLTQGKIGGVIVVCLVMLFASALTPIGSSFSRNNHPLFAQQQLSYTFAFVEPSLGSLAVNSAGYTTIDMPGCLTIGAQVGDPSLPVKPVSLLLPPGKTISSLTVTGTPVLIALDGFDIVKKPVLPYQAPVPFGHTPVQDFTINSAIYSSAAYYPSTRYSEYSIGISRGYTIATINLNPLQYNPAEGTLRYYPELAVTINLQAEESNQLFRNRGDDKAWVQKLVSNPEIADSYGAATAPTFDYPGGLCDPSDHYDYVIITTSQNGLDYWETTSEIPYNWDSLLAHHAGNGLTGTLVTRQQIIACSDYWNSTAMFNDTQALIREFCKDAYQDWGTLYVLIGGNDALVPARKMKTAYEGNIASDIYYSNLDNNFNADGDGFWGEEGDSGFDLYAELYIGRVTCNKPEDVSNWLTKNFYYAGSTEAEYLDNAAFYGGDTGWPCQGDDFIDYSAIKGTDDWLGPNPGYSGPFPTWVGFQYGFETWNDVSPYNAFDLSVKWTAEPPNAGWQGGSTSAAINGLKDAINNDEVTLIAGIAHANPQMSLDVSQSSWKTQYHNTKPFFVHDYGCHSGDFTSDPNGVLHTMLFHSDTKLAFACVYNTCYGWGNFYSTNSSSAFQQKEFWHYFFDLENNSVDLSEWQLGKAQAWSKDRMATTINWDPSYGTWRAIIQGCLLFGDPAQTLKTPSPSDPPEQPSKPVGDTIAIWHKQYTYTSSTTDPDGDDIYYLFDWGDGTTSGWLGPYSSGQTGTASHTWTELGEYYVRARARDIWGAGSVPSEPLIVTVTDNIPPNPPTVTGPTDVKPQVSYDYNFVGTDDLGDDLWYDIDWGDGNAVAGIGPYQSGETAIIPHTWNYKGTFTIKARTTDPFGAQSEWSTLVVVAPATYQFTLTAFFEQLFETFPRMFPILRYLLGY